MKLWVASKLDHNADCVVQEDRLTYVAMQIEFKHEHRQVIKRIKIHEACVNQSLLLRSEFHTMNY